VDQLELEAGNVLLVKLSADGEEAQAIYAVDCDDLIYPASTLKMLTALTIRDIAEPDEEVKIGMEVYIPPLDAARAGLEYGMTMTVRDLLEGLLLPSGADAAYVLGVYCGRKQLNDDQASFEDAIRAFVDEMNKKAEAIGTVHTTAKNVVGLDDSGQKTTVNDILILARTFLKDPVLAEICGIPRDTITSENGKTVSLKNTNKMLLSDSAYFNGDVAGVKTGTTSRAGNCLVSVFTVDGDRFLSIVMNSSYDGKFTDTQKLYDICAEAE
jgi:D-alanyl-D-alanine carboxypeptidase (penicillin-binding protein 5/6)